MSTYKTKDQYSNAMEVILQILKATKGERYIFRGQSFISPQPISSALYRQLKRENVTPKNIPGLLKKRQNELIEQIRLHTNEGDSDLARLMTSQHYGAKTNLLDFTEDVFVALFFACWRDENKDGLVAIKPRRMFRELETGKNVLPDNETVLLRPPGRNIRARDQSAVLLHAPQGILPLAEEEIVLIRKEWKKEILKLLENTHNISYETIFDDIQGVIEQRNREDEIRIATATQSTTDSKDTAEQYYNRGVKNATKRQVTPTIKSYKRLLSSPKTARRDNHISKHANSLIESFTNVLKHNPRDVETYYNRALVFQSNPTPDYKQALSDYDRAIELKPDYAEAYNNRGTVHREKAPPDYANAILDYTQAIELKPDYAEAYNNRGTAYREMAPPDYERAILDYTQAIELKPDYAEAYNDRGIAYATRPVPDYERAILDFTRAIELSPSYIKAYNNRGNAYISKLAPDYANAILDYDIAISLDPTYAKAYNNRGTAYCEMSPPDYESGILNFTQAIELNPDYAEAYNNRGTAYCEMSPPDYEMALSDYTRAIELEPNYAGAYKNRGLIYRMKTNPAYTKAIRDYDRAIELKPDYAEAYNERGNLYSMKSQPDHTKAIADYDRAINLNPDYAQAYNNRGIANYMKPQPDYTQALSDFNRALELDPSLATTYFLRGVVHAILGDGYKARSDYKEALEKNEKIADYPIPPELLSFLKSSTQSVQSGED